MSPSLLKSANTVIVLDFETTGLSPALGDRAIEIGAVKIEQGVVVEQFQGLMNPGRRISAFIEDYTGITNTMLKTAPPCGEVMMAFADFAGCADLVAHNASFDKRFLYAELERVRRKCRGEFACSMLVARRIYQQAENHKLGTLVEYANIPNDGTFHRALADAQMTAQLWLKMVDHLRDEHRIEPVPFSLMQKLSATPKNAVKRLLQRYISKQPVNC
ncbi:MAG: 3'-5' exonuclease [Gammaproteobacteria bacterium]|nr:3'-5' exonuclease [Gammaproteobacteria bacterium]